MFYAQLLGNGHYHGNRIMADMRALQICLLLLLLLLCQGDDGMRPPVFRQNCSTGR